MRWLRGLREAGIALAAAAAVYLPLNWLDIAPLRILETASLDLRFRLRGVEPPGGEIAVILVDDRSLAALGRPPLSRSIFANAVKVIDRAGAKVIVFDLLFAEPEQPVSASLRESAQAAANRLTDPGDAALRARLDQLLSQDPDGDLAAATRASGKVLLPFALAFTGPEETDEPAYLSDQAYQRLDQSPIAPIFPLQARSAVAPIARLAEAAAGMGHVNISFDRDGAPRYDYLALPFSGDFLPSMPVRAAAAYLAVPWGDVGLALGGDVTLGTQTIPTDPAMRLLVNYRGPRGTFPTYSFVDVLNGEVPDDKLAGRIVLIGASYIGDSDTNPAPFNNTPMPGTERMASIIDSLISHDIVRENPEPWPIIELCAVLVLALLAGIMAAALPTRFAIVTGTLPLVVWGVGIQAAFNHGLWLPAIIPLSALAAATLSALLFRYGFVDRQRRWVQAAFQHYLAPDLVKQLASNPQQLQLGGATRSITIMFSDIRGFTSISEQFKTNPEALSRLINRGFLTPMTRLIMGKAGTIDKYMGDCIMAFWNAPLDDAHHADHACAAALGMLVELDRINVELEAEAEAEGRTFQPLHVGIGLNTGECVVGNMGSDERFAYTAMGDAVNLASRLEGQSKTYHVGNVIGEATREAAPDWAAVELDLIAVKGKEDAVRIYTLLGDAALARSPAFVAHAPWHERMLACYRAQDWAGAQAALAKCRNYGPELAGFYDLYAERIAHFTSNPPGPAWAGVFVAETK